MSSSVDESFLERGADGVVLARAWRHELHVIVPHCPFCDGLHAHGGADGVRAPDCGARESYRVITSRRFASAEDLERELAPIRREARRRARRRGAQP